MQKMIRKTVTNKTDTKWDAPSWANDRWNNIKRDYSKEDVEKLKGSISIDYTLAENGAKSYGNYYIMKIMLIP